MTRAWTLGRLRRYLVIVGFLVLAFLISFYILQIFEKPTSAELVLRSYEELPYDVQRLDDEVVSEWKAVLHEAIARRREELLLIAETGLVVNRFDKYVNNLANSHAMTHNDDDVFNQLLLNQKPTSGNIPNPSPSWRKIEILSGSVAYPLPAVRLECGVVNEDSDAFVRIVSLRTPGEFWLDFGVVDLLKREEDRETWPDDDIKLISALQNFPPREPSSGWEEGEKATWMSYGEPPPELDFHPLSPAGRKLWAVLCNELALTLDEMRDAAVNMR